MAKTVVKGKVRWDPRTGKAQKLKVTKTVKVKPMRDVQKAQVISLMRKMIGKESENKEVGWKVEETLHNSAIGNADLVPILGEIGSGVSGETRIGDRVKPKSLVVTGVVSLSDVNPDTKPMYVRVIIATQKDVKNGAQVGVNTDAAHLLRPALAGAPEQAFNGNRMELNYRVNDNKFRAYKDFTRLLAPVSVASGNGGYQSQFKFRYVFKSLPANLTYDEGSGDWANNFAPFLGIGYAYADGSAPDTIQTRISTSVFARLTFEDS